MATSLDPGAQEGNWLGKILAPTPVGSQEGPNRANGLQNVGAEGEKAF